MASFKIDHLKDFSSADLKLIFTADTHEILAEPAKSFIGRGKDKGERATRWNRVIRLANVIIVNRFVKDQL